MRRYRTAGQQDPRPKDQPPRAACNWPGPTTYRADPEDCAASFPDGWLRDTLAIASTPARTSSKRSLPPSWTTPRAVAAKGEYIRAGVNEELDRLRKIATGGKEYLVELQQKEAGRSGISSLKIGFNNVFGYYLEVTNAHKNKVPAEWMRKQTLANAERYITPELKEYEEQITGAEEKILAMELELYEQLLVALQDYIAPMQANGTCWRCWTACFALPPMPCITIIKNRSSTKAASWS